MFNSGLRISFFLQAHAKISAAPRDIMSTPSPDVLSWVLVPLAVDAHAVLVGKATIAALVCSA